MEGGYEEITIFDQYLALYIFIRSERASRNRRKIVTVERE